MPQERLIGKNKVQVILIESFNTNINAMTDRIVTNLPARFRANNFDYSVEFELNQEAQITNLKLESKIGLANELKLPIDRLRSMAILEATRVLPCFEKLQNESLYKRIGEIHDKSPHGAKQKLVAKHFGWSIAWANKHITIGKQKYPQYFTSCNKPTKKEGNK